MKYREIRSADHIFVGRCLWEFAAIFGDICGSVDHAAYVLSLQVQE